MRNEMAKSCTQQPLVSSTFRKRKKLDGALADAGVMSCDDVVHDRDDDVNEEEDDDPYRGLHHDRAARCLGRRGGDGRGRGVGR